MKETETHYVITEEEKKQVLRVEYARKEQKNRRRENELAGRCKNCNHCTPYMCDSYLRAGTEGELNSICDVMEK